MTIAITGAAGHIGHRLVHELVKRNERVNALIHESSRASVLPTEANIVVGDVRSADKLKLITDGADSVVHLAFGGNATSNSINIESTKRLLDLSVKFDCSQFVFLSSITAHSEVITENSSTYAKTKCEAETEIQKYSDLLDHLILYPSRVIGPGDYQLKRYKPYKKVVSNKILFPPMYKIDSHRNYVHIDTVVDSILSGLFDNLSGKHVVTGDTLTEQEYFSLIAKHSNRTHWLPRVPKPQYTLPPLLHSLEKLNIISYESYSFQNNETKFPDSLENQSPVSTRGIKKAVKDTMIWYQKAGVL